MYSAYIDDRLLFVDYANTDVTDATLSLSANSAGNFNATLFKSNACYDHIEPMISTIKVFRTDGDGETEIWRGRPISVETDFLNRHKISCDGALTFLNDTIYPDETFSGTPEELISEVLSNHNGKVSANRRIYLGSIDTIHSGTDTYDINYGISLDILNNEIIDKFGGNFQIRYSSGTAYLDYISDVGTVCDQTINFGENLLDFTNNFEAVDMVTVVVPFGKDDDGERVTVESVHGGSIYVINQNALNNYGRIEKVMTWDDISNPQTLLYLAETYLYDTQFETLTMEVSAFDLHYMDIQIDAFSLLNNVRCVSEPHGLNKVMPISKIDIDFFKPENTKITLGWESKKQDMTSNLSSGYISKDNVEEVVTPVIKQTVISEFPEIPVTVIEAGVVKADVMMSTFCFARYMLVQFLETNFEAIDARHARSNTYRRYIRIYNETITVYEATLSDTKVWYHDPGGTGLFWTAVSGVNAYKYFTYQSPTTIAKDKWPSGVTEQEFIDMYKVWVYEASTTVTKGVLGYPATSSGTSEPEFLLGAGDGNGDHGKGKIKKTENGFERIYISRTDGKEYGKVGKDDGNYTRYANADYKDPSAFGVFDTVDDINLPVGSIAFIRR